MKTEPISLVIGAAGFLGHSPVRYLVSKGTDVPPMACLPSKVADLASLTDDVVLTDFGHPKIISTATLKWLGSASVLLREMSRRVPFFFKNRAFDISKVRQILDYESQTHFAGEIAKTIAAYRASGELPRATHSVP